MRALPALVAIGLLAAGCGGDDGAPKPIEGAAKEAANVVERLERATAQGDFQTICDDLFAAATRRQAGGADCASVLSRRAEGVRAPKIRIRSIELQANGASVHVRTTARGQAAADDVIRLEREDGVLRIASLG